MAAHSTESASDSTTPNSNSNSSTPRLTVESLLNLLNDKAEFVPFTVDHDRLEESSMALLRLVFPDWFASNDTRHLKLVQCTNGITNKLMKCKNLATGQVVLVRAYGKKSELIIDRQAELITFAALQENGLAPPLHCRFENGFVYGYLPGIPLKASQMKLPEFFPLIARKIALWHQVDSVPGDRSPRLFKTLKKWFKSLPKTYSRPEIQVKFLSTIDLRFLEQELSFLETTVATLNCPIVFCHNDLLSANIIYNPESKDVSFIDYEYGSFNYRSFDIANHFCEFAGFDCDYSQYPSLEAQRAWIHEYLTFFQGDNGHVAREDLDAVVKEVAVFTLAAHFFWGLWGLIQAQHSDIHFDYMGYAAARFTEYKTRKAALALLQE